MTGHKNARLTVHGRTLLGKRVLEEGLQSAVAAQSLDDSIRTTDKRLPRFRAEGPAVPQGRSSLPGRGPTTATSMRSRTIGGFRHPSHRVSGNSR